MGLLFLFYFFTPWLVDLSIIWHSLRPLQICSSFSLSRVIFIGVPGRRTTIWAAAHPIFLNVLSSFLWMGVTFVIRIGRIRMRLLNVPLSFYITWEWGYFINKCSFLFLYHLGIGVFFLKMYGPLFISPRNRGIFLNVSSSSSFYITSESGYLF